MRFNSPPIREPVFDAYVELPQKNPNLPPIRVPIKFVQTTRPWASWFFNLAKQSNTGAEAEIAEDLFAGISPMPAAHSLTEQDLFGNLSPALVARASSEQDLFGNTAVAPTSALSGLARHFLFMGS